MCLFLVYYSNIERKDIAMRSDLEILGEVIGTVNGWDQGGDAVEFMFYDFIPATELLDPMTGCCVQINFGTGIFEAFNDDGEVVHSVNILHILKQL